METQEPWSDVYCGGGNLSSSLTNVCKDERVPEKYLWFKGSYLVWSPDCKFARHIFASCRVRVVASCVRPGMLCHWVSDGTVHSWKFTRNWGLLVCTDLDGLRTPFVTVEVWHWDSQLPASHIRLEVSGLTQPQCASTSASREGATRSAVASSTFPSWLPP